MNEQYSGKGISALIKLIYKLSLIPESVTYNEKEASGKLPIWYFASNGLLKEHEATQKVADSLGIGFRRIDKLSEASIAELIETSLFAKISLQQWKEMRALPFQLKDNRLHVIFANPLDNESKKDLEFNLGVQIIVSAGLDSEITSFIDKRTKSDTDASLNSLLDDSGELTFEETTNETHLESKLHHEDVAAPLVIRLVDKIFSDSIEKRASDIHITPERDKLSVKVRIDGLLHPLLQVPGHLKNPTIARIKLLCGMDISERRKPQDGRLRLKSSTGNVDLRLSTVPSVHGENIVVRVLSSNATKVSLDAIGFGEASRDRFTRALRGSSKVVLVAGPTGSGKTSTLYAGLTYLADGQRNIITIEDPIEYRIDGITQIQVNHKTGMTFSEGLKSTLRQDPDVIMVGEIRDLDTAQTAMQAAQTGHLVLSTIHTNSAPAGVIRLLDLGVPGYLISSSVSTIVAQRLVRTLCKACAKQNEDSDSKTLLDLGIDPSGVKKPCGCPECNNTGYTGRTGIFSILELTDGVREAVRTNLGEIEIAHRAREHGFKSLWEEALPLVAKGITSFEEIERVLGPIDSEEIQSLNKTPSRNVSEYRKASGLSKPKLLLVEDDETTRTVLAMLFRDQMYDVIEAENGVEGLEKVYEHQPCLIVSDLMMPRMSGVEMLQKLKGDNRTRNIPILMLTAASSEENELKLIEHGADDFVGKTSDSKIMLARVNRLLSRAA